MTHLPQLKSICINVSELIRILDLDCFLRMTPQFIGLNINWKYLIDRRLEYPAEQRDSHEVMHVCFHCLHK
jgi:hypothetical protein